jgi:hypothetical protein
LVIAVGASLALQEEKCAPVELLMHVLAARAALRCNTVDEVHAAARAPSLANVKVLPFQPQKHVEEVVHKKYFLLII